MLNVYYFFSNSLPAYLPTDSQMESMLEHCARSVLLTHESIARKTLNNIDKVDDLSTSRPLPDDGFIQNEIAMNRTSSSSKVNKSEDIA